MLLRFLVTGLVATSLIGCSTNQITELNSLINEGARAYQSGDPSQMMHYQLKALDNSTESGCVPPDPECTEE